MHFAELERVLVRLILQRLLTAMVTAIYGGPGDGFWFMLAILFPWVFMQFVNVGLALYCSRTVGQAARAWAILLALWIAAVFAGGSLLECPKGMVCRCG